MTSRGGRPREFEEDEVLDAAVELFWRHGYDRMTIPQICARTGVARQSLYNAFGDKRQLFLRILRRYGARRLDPLVASLAGAGAPLEAVVAWVRRWSDHSPGCLFGNTSAIFGGGDPEVAQIIIEGTRRLEDALEDALTRARAAGALRDEADPSALARLLVASSHGVALAKRVGRPREEIRASVEAAVALLAGLRSEGAQPEVPKMRSGTGVSEA